MRCSSARATARCWSPRAASATRCASPTRRGRGCSTATSCCPSCCTSASSRPTSASARTATVLQPLDEAALRRELQAAFDAGIRACAIVFMHGYRYTAHEQAAARAGARDRLHAGQRLARGQPADEAGRRAATPPSSTPTCRRSCAATSTRSRAQMPGVRLFFMQSVGGLTEAHRFQGKDAILSGPAGGIVGMVRTAVAGRPPQGHRLRHGRHLDRRRALRRRVRARLRDPGRRRAHARADDEHPHGGRRRRLDPALRRRAAARRPGQRRRQPRAGQLPPRRPAGRRPTPTCCSGKIQPAHFPAGVRPGGDAAARPRRRRRRSSRRWPPQVRGATGREATRRVAGRGLPAASRCRTWPTRSSASRWRAATTSRATRCSASAAPAASMPAGWPTRWA